MTPDQFIHWLKGYLADKQGVEAVTIKQTLSQIKKSPSYEVTVPSNSNYTTTTTNGKSILHD
jgi:hypothetical protein